VTALVLTMGTPPHAPAEARRAESSPLAAEGDEPALAARATAKPREAPAQKPTVEVGLELLLRVLRHPDGKGAVVDGAVECLQVVAHDLVERRRLRSVALGSGLYCVPLRVVLRLEGRDGFHFIERTIGISPDGGSGAFEVILFLIPMVGLGYLWMRRRRGPRHAMPILHSGPHQGCTARGGRPEELMEAIWVAAEMRAGGAYAHANIALAAIEAEQAPKLGEGQ